jgi:hypothetical protein
MSYVKLAGGAIVAALGVLYVALTDDTVSAKEWVEVAIAAIVGTGLVAADPRKNTDSE